MGVVAVIALATGSVWWRQHRGGSTQRQVLVTSTPSGATVKFGTQVLGVTPWAGDLPSGQDVVLDVSAPGFQTSKQTLAVGSATTVSVTLKRSR